jgi:hypothetical protein
MDSTNQSFQRWPEKSSGLFNYNIYVFRVVLFLEMVRLGNIHHSIELGTAPTRLVPIPNETDAGHNPRWPIKDPASVERKSNLGG